MIQVKNLHKSFNNREVLNGLSFKLSTGNIGVIYGKNAEGKSTLLKCLCGLLKVNQGLINLSERDMQNVGLVLEDSLLINKLKVFEFLSLICELKKIPKSIYTKKIDLFLTNLDYEKERNTMIGELSKGTRSKLSLSGALIHNPKLLILDEPFSGMDLVAIENAKRLLKSYADKDCTILITTHQTEILFNFIDYIFVMKNGRINYEYQHDTFFLNLKEKEITVSEFLKDKI